MESSHLFLERTGEHCESTYDPERSHTHTHTHTHTVQENVASAEGHTWETTLRCREGFLGELVPKLSLKGFTF